MLTLYRHACYASRMQNTPAPVNKFPHHSTRELLQMNATYLREYRADPTDGKLAAVIKTSEELTRRGA